MAKKKSIQTEVPTEKTNEYKDFEDELNEYPTTPFPFHESDLVNLEIHDNKIKIKIRLAHTFVDLDFLDDKHHVILDAVYEGIKIKDITLYDGFDFRNAEISNFSEKENGDLALAVYQSSYELFFYLRFSYKKYRWSVCDVIDEDEYWIMASPALDTSDAIYDLTEKYSPKWAKFED